MAGDRQPQTGSTGRAGSISLKETLENTRQVILCDTNAGIFYRKDNRI